MDIIIKSGTPVQIIESLLQSDPRLVSIHTTRQYKSDLFQFEEWRRGRTLTKTLVETYAAELQGGGYAPRTINQRLAAIRWYARKMVDIAVDYMHNDELAAQAGRITQVRDVKDNGDIPEAGRYIESWELAALIGACQKDDSPAGTRDAATIALAWATGLRRDEISRLEISDLHPNQDGIDILVRHAKGNKQRKAYINDGAQTALEDWLHLRATGTEEYAGRLFVKVTKDKKILPGSKLSGEALRKMLYKRSGLAGLAEPITWHDFRRTFATNLWNAGIDGVTIQKLMGHANQNQTARYNRAPEQLRRRAVRVLHVPYKSK